MSNEIETYRGSKELLQREAVPAPVAELESYSQDIRCPKSWFGRGYNKLLTQKTVILSMIGSFALSGVAGILTMNYPLFGPPAGLLIGTIATGLWGIPATVASHRQIDRAEKEYLERLAAVAVFRDGLTARVEEWLLETYGLRFASESARIQFGDSAMGIRPLGWNGLPFKSIPPIKPPKPGLFSAVTLKTSNGARIDGDFYLNEDGSFEVRKHRILDPNENPYFTSLREELS